MWGCLRRGAMRGRKLPHKTCRRRVRQHAGHVCLTCTMSREARARACAGGRKGGWDGRGGGRWRVGRGRGKGPGLPESNSASFSALNLRLSTRPVNTNAYERAS
jgi:hypothetical protein